MSEPTRRTTISTGVINPQVDQSAPGASSPNIRPKDLALQRLIEGVQPAAVKKELIRHLAMEAAEAEAVVNSCARMIDRRFEDYRITWQEAVGAILKGLVVCLIAGVLWSVALLHFSTRLGFLAWPMGVIAGVSVGLSVKRKQSVLMQVLAVCLTAAGVAVAKYATFYLALNTAARANLGDTAEALFSLLDQTTFNMFLNYPYPAFELADWLWLPIAALSAWKFSRGSVQRRYVRTRLRG